MRSQVNSVSSCQVAAAVVLLSQMMDIGYCDDLERGVVELWHDGIKATVQQIGPDPLPFQGVTLEVRYRNTAAKPVPHPALSGENVLYWGQTPGFEMRAGVFRNKQLLIKDAGLFRGLPFCESKELEPVDGLFEADLFRLPGMITLFSNTKVIGYKPAYDRENLEWTLPPNGEFVCRMVILEEQMTARWSLKPEFLFPIPGEYQLRLRDLWNVKTGFQSKVSVAPALTVRVAAPVLLPDRHGQRVLQRDPAPSVANAPNGWILLTTRSPVS
ncbi:MAG: hypothetical protein H8E37_08620, partial [Planctomycetes bacterium]|nr:hypothetical protein [Planctomycetota bacterium]